MGLPIEMIPEAMLISPVRSKEPPWQLGLLLIMFQLFRLFTLSHDRHRLWSNILHLDRCATQRLLYIAGPLGAFRRPTPRIPFCFLVAIARYVPHWHLPYDDARSKTDNRYNWTPLSNRLHPRNRRSRLYCTLIYLLAKWCNETHKQNAFCMLVYPPPERGLQLHQLRRSQNLVRNTLGNWPPFRIPRIVRQTLFDYVIIHLPQAWNTKRT